MSNVDDIRARLAELDRAEEAYSLACAKSPKFTTPNRREMAIKLEATADELTATGIEDRRVLLKRIEELEAALRIHGSIGDVLCEIGDIAKTGFYCTEDAKNWFQQIGQLVAQAQEYARRALEGGEK